MSRILTTIRAAEHYGFANSRNFMNWARKLKDKGFPWPEREHHLVWDTKAIDLFLDRQAGIKPNATHWGQTILAGLTNGNGQSALSGS